MTAHELARKLLAGPDLMVTVREYEGGVDEITTISDKEKLHLNVNDEWYYGKHEYKPYSCENGCSHNIVEAINIG